MGAIIPNNKKREYLPFIKSNFNKISQREIARRLKIGKTTVNRWSEEMGLKFKKHTVNEKFFDVFNENSSYILGLIFSDGNISWNTKKGYYSITITAAEKDKDHLEKIRNILSSTKPLLYAPKTKSYRLIVNSKKMCRRLMQLGVIPKKSLSVKFPEKIPKENLKHFLRGVIDGDGSISYLDRKRSPYFSIKIYSGSESFLSQLAMAVKKITSLKADVQKRANKNLYTVSYTCSKGEKLAKYLYSDANIFLERKYLPYKNKVLRRDKNE